jgi:integrase
MKLTLTEARIRALAAPKTGRLTVHDAKVSGLVLMVTAKGSKAFKLYRRLNGVPTRIMVGKWPQTTVELARQQAIKLSAGILDGRNPVEEKRTRRTGLTLGAAFEAFMEQAKVRGSATTAVANRSRFATCLEDWSDRRVADIRREEVITLHRTIGAQRGKVSANRAIQLLRAVINHAALEGANPASGIELFREQSRERFLSADELAKFFKALDAEPDQTFRDFFALLVYTGARRGNVQSMRWQDVDLASGTWRIPATEFKTRRASTVVLSPQSLEILLRRRKQIESEFVFPSHGKSGHLAEPKAAWDRQMKRAGLVNLTPHDLRRTRASWQAMLGSSLPIIGKSLGHTRAEATLIYSRLDIESVRQSVNAACAAIQAAASKATAKDGTK